jgi:hypothetical protein
VRSALALVLLVPACAHQHRSALERLQEAVDGYNHAFRWKNYERAAMFLPNDLRATFIAAYEDDEDSLQVEDFAIRKVDLHSDQRATVLVRLRYMLLPSVVVQSTNLTQHWAEIEGQWILESEENSVRDLDPEKKPRDPRVLGTEPPKGADGETSVELERPGEEPTPLDEARPPESP